MSCSHMKKIYHDHIDTLCLKGYYPYEWVDDSDKLNHEGLPPKEAFYSTLTQQSITVEEYKHALNVYETMGCKTFKYDHELY